MALPVWAALILLAGEAGASAAAESDTTFVANEYVGPITLITGGFTDSLA